MSTGRTYWLAKDSAWHRRDGIVELGEEFGPAGPLIVDWLGCEAKAQNAGGFVKTGFRAVARSCYVDPDTARKVVRHAAEIGVLDELEANDRLLSCHLNGWVHDQGQDARRALRWREAAGHASTAAVAARWAYYGGVCWICREAPATAMDHVKPLAAGGSRWPANLRPACRPCNSRKRDHWPLEVAR